MPEKRSILRGPAPKALLNRLIGWPARPAARERDLTVMFTDVEGFTRLAEALTPAETADLLASHFGILAACIAREGGAVDKVWGDGLLALWDARDGGDAAAAPALRAALAIRGAVEADNAAREARGLPAVRLRVGLHTGPLLMAPLGGVGPLGVTPLGDTVNVAQRLEDAARHVAPEQEAVRIVASDAVAARSGRGFRFEPLGEIPVRGRRHPVRAFRLAGR